MSTPNPFEDPNFDGSVKQGTPNPFADPNFSGRDGALVRGAKTMSKNVGISAGLVSGDTTETAKRVAELDAYSKLNPKSKERQALGDAFEKGDGFFGGLKGALGQVGDNYNKAGSFVGGLRSLAKDAYAMGEAVVEQTPNMLLPTAGMVAGGAAGSTAGPVGTVVGAFTGGAAGNTMVEGGSQVMDALAKANINPSDTAAVKAYLDKNGDKILGQSAVKGSVLGAVDVATVGLGHSILNSPIKEATGRALKEMGVDMADKAAVKAAMNSPAMAERLGADAILKQQSTGLRNIGRNAGAAALEPAGEFTGEFVGQGLATGDWDTKGAGLEALSSIGQSGAMYAGQKAVQFATAPKIGIDNTQTQGDGTQPPVAPSTTPGAPPAATPPAGPTLGQSLTGTPMADLMGGSGLTGGANPLQAGLSTLTSNNQMYPGMNTEPTGYTVDPETGAIIPAEPVGVRQMAEPAAQVEAPAPVATPAVRTFGESLTGTPVADMLGSGGMSGPANPLQSVLDNRTPSQRMGLNPAAGGLTAAAAIAVDSGASPVTAGMGLRALSGLTDVTPIERTAGQIGTPRRLGESPIIDVQAREVRDTELQGQQSIGMTPRIGFDHPQGTGPAPDARSNGLAAPQNRLMLGQTKPTPTTPPVPNQQAATPKDDKPAREAGSIVTATLETNEDKLRFAAWADAHSGKSVQEVQLALVRSEFGPKLATNEVKQVAEAVSNAGGVVADQARINTQPAKQKSDSEKLASQINIQKMRVKAAEKAAADARDVDQFGLPIENGPKRKSALVRLKKAEDDLAALEAKAAPNQQATPAPEAGPTNQGATNGQKETLLKAEQPTGAAAMVSGAPVAEQPSDTTKPERQYNLVAINEKTGKKTQLNATPLTHQQAVTMKSKSTEREGRRIQLEQIVQPSDTTKPVSAPVAANPPLPVNADKRQPYELSGLDPLGWNSQKLADAYDMQQLNALYKDVQAQHSHRTVDGAPVDERGFATSEQLTPEGKKKHDALKKAIDIVYSSKKPSDTTKPGGFIEKAKKAAKRNKPKTIEEADDAVKMTGIAGEVFSGMREEAAQKANDTKKAEWAIQFTTPSERLAASDISRYDGEKLSQVIDSGRVTLDRANEMIDSAVSSGWMVKDSADRLKRMIAPVAPAQDAAPAQPILTSPTKSDIEAQQARAEQAANNNGKLVVASVGDKPAAKPVPEAPAADSILDDELKDALGKLGDVLGDVFGSKLNVTGPQYTAGDLLPALSKVVELLVKKGFKSFSQSIGKAAQLMRADQRTAAHVDSISPRQWKAAYNAIADGFEGTDSEDAISAMKSDEVLAIVAPKVAQKPEAPVIPNAEQAKTLAESLYQAIKANQMPKDNPALKKLVEAFDGKPADQFRIKEAQESLETAITMMARDLVAKKEGNRSTFDMLLRLYESQPNLNIRTSTSITNQAYSTPAPLAWLASQLAGITNSTVAHEPTGGNGMLLIAADPSKAIVNELNDLRIEALKAQGFKPTQKDAATQQLVPDGVKPDAVVTNPPFGSIKDADGKTVKVKVDGFSLGQIDHLIAARALDTMKDDGRATLIIGANKVAGGLSTDDRIFFNWLYSHYNVAGHFEVEGDLYNRQGAGWPVRVITINGRQKSDKFSPVAGTVQRVDNWNAVYEQFTKSLESSKNQAVIGSTTAADGAGARPSITAATPAKSGEEKPAGGKSSTGNVSGASAGAVSNRAEPAAIAMGDSPDEQRLNAQPFVPQPQPGQNPDGAARPEKPVGTASVSEAKGNEFQAPYTPRSARKDEGVLIPSNMAQPTQDALSKLEDEVGDIDEFARNELGYATVADLHNALMGLQVDSVATSIYQIKKGKAVVIADQTGIGKGRQAASIIRWAALQGMTPVFVSVKPSLFTDMYGDLADIGTNDVSPFIMNGDAWVAGEGGSKLFANKPGKHKQAIQEIANSGQLPEGSNALFMTYSQINVANVQRQALMALAPNAVFVLDESHNAAGASSTGEFVIGALEAAKGVVYLSATYAKRPDNMPLYFKTDIGEAAADTEGLADAMASGGLPLQTVVSNNLVKAGQMFRRERSYDGVSIASVFDTANRALHERMSDEATKALRAIVSADRMFHEIYVKSLAKRLALEGATVQDKAGNQIERGVQHTEFSSVVHNFVKQMLLGLKAQSAADEAIASLKRGEKPIIAVENTMGSFLTEYAAANGIGQGDSLGAFDYRTVLSRALARSRVIVEVLPNGDKVKRPVSMAELDEVTQDSYRAAQAVIDGLTLSIPVPPIDWIRAEIARAGYKVAEITGRSLSVDYGNPKKPILSAIDAAEQKDKVNTTRQFNSGNLDALILNVAGSTGISLHASEKFEDQRQRHMIVAQAAGDINIFMQMLGRVHRTGQVRLPKYTILSVDLPTEKRPTAVLSIKMKSLNANTSSNTESATSVKSSDILNKYGDQIVNQYLSDNYALARALGIEQEIGTDPSEDIARKATGRLALQPIEVQTGFYEEVESQYEALIDYLNKTNQNDLEPRTFDFDAKETRQEVLFEGQDKESPFGEDAIYGEYSIKAQGTPMKPDEIRAVMSENLGGMSPVAHTQKMLDDLDAKYKAYLDTVDDGSKDSASTARNIGRSFLMDHRIGSTFRVDINSEPFNAVVLNVRNMHKETGNPYSLSKIQVTVAVNGALRSISVPATQFRKIEVSSITPSLRVEQLFREQPPNQRETAKIVTGNLLAAYGELQGVRGTIVNFTKQDGTVEQGILLPKLFDYTKNTRGDYHLKDGESALKFLQKSENKDIGRFGIMTRDGNVRVLPSGQGIRVQVPKSKLKGAKYFLDKGLIEVGGDFVTQGAYMVVTVRNPSDAVKMLDLLMKKQALYTLPSMADEAKEITGAKPAVATSKDQKPSISRDTESPRTPAATIRAAITKAYGNLLDKLEAKGLVMIAQTEREAIEAAAQARADKTGGDVGAIAVRMMSMDGLDVKYSANGNIEGFFDRQTGKSFLVADNLTAASAPGTLMHEVGIHMAAGGKMAALFKRAGSLLKTGTQNEFIQRVRARMARAGETSDEEAAAYITTEYERDRTNAPVTVGKWIADLTAAVRAWLFSKGVILRADQLTVADIAAVARANARSMARGGPNGGPGGGRAFSRTALPATLNIDGKDRPTTNSNGQPIHPTEDGVRNFYRWFGKSKVVDEQGRPLVVYHGTAADFNVFMPSNMGNLGPGIYFTPDIEQAEAYARTHKGARVISAYVKAENPLLIDNSNTSGAQLYAAFPAKSDAETIAKVRESGRDAVWAVNSVQTKWGATTREIAVYSPTQIKSATDNTGAFSPTDPDIRFSRGGGIDHADLGTVGENDSPSSQWDAPLASSWDDKIYKLQDKNIDTKRVIQAIKKMAGDIQDKLNVYLQEELYHGRTAKRVLEFGRGELNPALDELAAMGYSIEDLEEYMHARHAPEANVVLAARNPTREMIDTARSEAKAEIKRLKAELSVDGLGKDEVKALKAELKKAEAKLKSWTGVAAFKGTEEERNSLSGMKTEEAEAYFRNLPAEDAAKLKKVAEKMDAIMAETSNMMVAYHLESQETVDGWNSMYRHYIPLHREGKDDGSMGTGQGFSIKGREVKGRTGSRRKVVNIVAHIAEAREKTIVRGEKNRVAQALVGLVTKYPNADFWKTGAPPSERVFDRATGKVKNQVNPAYKSLPNVVMAKVMGEDGKVKEVAVTFNENDERAVRMAGALKNLDTPQVEGWLGTVAKATRYFAAVNTQFNPIFGVVNLVRDVQGAMINLGATPLADQKMKIARDSVDALAGIYRDIRATRRGEVGSSKWSELYEQFQHDGGQTGFRNLFETTDDRSQELKDRVSPTDWAKSPLGRIMSVNGKLTKQAQWMRDGWAIARDWLSDYNETMESATRLAVYKAALDKGMTREQAASMAKNITVNFNRKGTMGTQAGALYAFFNAAMQGTARMGETLVTMEPGQPKTMRLSAFGKKVVYGGVLLGAVQALALAAGGFGDDEPPDFERERNLLIPTGWTGVGPDKGYIKIPMPLGLHVIPGIGRMGMEFVLSGGEDPAKAAIKFGSMMADAFNPIGNAGLSMQTIAPTVLDPLAALVENKDWTGKNIARESFNKDAPMFSQHKDSATFVAKFLAELVNYATGGNEYVGGAMNWSPDQIDYLIGQVTGGVGRELSKVEQTATGAFTGDETPIYKVPLLGRFAGSASGKSGEANAFYANADKLNRLETELKGMVKDGKAAEASALRMERPESRMIVSFNMAERQVQKLRKQKSALIEAGASAADVRAVDERITAIMQNMNQRMLSVTGN